MIILTIIFTFQPFEPKFAHLTFSPVKAVDLFFLFRPQIKRPFRSSIFVTKHQHSVTNVTITALFSLTSPSIGIRGYTRFYFLCPSPPPPPVPIWIKIIHYSKELFSLRWKPCFINLFGRIPLLSVALPNSVLSRFCHCLFSQGRWNDGEKNRAKFTFGVISMC